MWPDWEGFGQGFNFKGRRGGGIRGDAPGGGGQGGDLGTTFWVQTGQKRLWQLYSPSAPPRDAFKGGGREVSSGFARQKSFYSFKQKGS